ncbi:uncharacterized protein LOC120350663 [Nilaparvata lugens]|uniref:uncharacterized protein LOC120350663 n=1 Tax=Nilaparvata lugens TaxID=108931 RepID=UPI00193E7D9D|nr:uncharacterized protein LOC120350663 [Nilaparvata lugens]
MSRSCYNGYILVFGGDLNSAFDINQETCHLYNLKNLLRQFNLRRFNTLPTRDQAFLDNVFSNTHPDTTISSVIEFPYSDHDCVIICVPDCSIKTSINKFVAITTRPVTIDEMLQFNQALTLVDWKAVLDKPDPSVMFESFLNVVLYYFNLTIPKMTCRKNKSLVKNRKRTKRKADWYTPELGRLKILLTISHENFKKVNTEHAKTVYQRCRALYKKSLDEAKRESIVSIIESSNNSCRKAWQIIKTISSSKCVKGFTTPMPNILNEYFIRSVDDVHEKIVKPSISAIEMLNESVDKEHNATFCFHEVSQEVESL